MTMSPNGSTERLATRGATVRTTSESSSTALTEKKARRICPLHPAQSTTTAAHSVISASTSVAGTVTR